MCICTQSLAVDHIGCSICVYQADIPISSWHTVFVAHLIV